MERTDLKAELEQKEREYLRAQGKLPAWDTSEALFLEDTSAERNEFEEPESNKHDSGGDSLEEDSLGEDASEESDEDDTELLLAELEKIKRERADEAARKARLHPASEEHGTVSGLFDQNPLLSQEEGRSSFAVKKSWRDDVVFRNQANHETKKQKRFVNDTVRNDFHKQFLDKYVR